MQRYELEEDLKVRDKRSGKVVGTLHNVDELNMGLVWVAEREDGRGHYYPYDELEPADKDTTKLPHIYSHRRITMFRGYPVVQRTYYYLDNGKEINVGKILSLPEKGKIRIFKYRYWASIDLGSRGFYDLGEARVWVLSRYVK